MHEEKVRSAKDCGIRFSSSVLMGKAANGAALMFSGYPRLSRGTPEPDYSGDMLP